jgi:Ca-activated chloride channel family protein
MKKTVLIVLLFSLQASAQTAQTYISKGNEYYLQLKFDLAEAQYRQALNLQRPGMWKQNTTWPMP